MANSYKAPGEGLSKALTVEFLGIPGSGKSWLNRRMLERLRLCSNGVPLQRSQMWSMRFDTDETGPAPLAKAAMRKRVFQLATAWQQRQFLLFALPHLVRDMRTTGIKWHSARALLSDLMIAPASRRWNGHACVVGLDESLLQRSGMFLSHSRHPVDTATVRQFAHYTPKADIVVWVRFNPGRTLVAGGWEKSVRRWDVATHLARAVLVQPIFGLVLRAAAR